MTQEFKKANSNIREIILISVLESFGTHGITLLVLARAEEAIEYQNKSGRDGGCDYNGPCFRVPRSVGCLEEQRTNEVSCDKESSQTN